MPSPVLVYLDCECDQFGSVHTYISIAGWVLLSQFVVVDHNTCIMLCYINIILVTLLISGEEIITLVPV